MSITLLLKINSVFRTTTYLQQGKISFCIFYLLQILLYDITGDNTYKTRVENFVTAWMPSGSISYTTCGLAWRLEWASLRYSGKFCRMRDIVYKTLKENYYNFNTMDYLYIIYVSTFPFSILFCLTLFYKLYL